jgi:hypothetical protein
MKTTLQILAVMLLIAAMSQAQIKSAKSGAWGADTTWVGGIVPSAADDVLIDTSNTVTVNIAAAVCKNLTVKGTVTFPDVNALSITVNGDLQVDSAGRFNTYSSGSPLGIRYQTITIYKNLTVKNGGFFDMRRGSGATVGVGRVVFTGSENTTISLSQTVYGSSIEEFNSVVINKSGGAKVILASGNLFQNNNATNAPDTLVLISGVIETGSNTWVHLATTGGSVQGASNISYIYGRLGRGITNSGGNATREFPLGNGGKLRPISVRVAGPANATGHYVWAQLKEANANTGTSTFTGTIDKVSAIRHYEVGYMQNAGTAAAMPAYGFVMSYAGDDGVNAGNQDLRIAYSKDSRATWNGIGPVTDTTKLGASYYSFTSDSVTPHISIGTGTSMFISLARATGTTTNSLENTVLAPAFALGTKSMNFGAVKINVVKKDSVAVSNSGNDTLKVTSIVSNSGDFTVVPSSLKVPPAGSAYVYITFAPTTIGAKTGKVVLQHNATSATDTVSLSGTGDPSTSVRPDGIAPSSYAVHQNYPNPFNPETAIAFEMPERASVKIEVYSLLGNSVEVLQNGMMNAGVHTVRWNASNKPSGIYFYRVTMGTKTITKRMMLLK